MVLSEERTLCAWMHVRAYLLKTMAFPSNQYFSYSRIFASLAFAFFYQKKNWILFLRPKGPQEKKLSNINIYPPSRIAFDRSFTKPMHNASYFLVLN